MDFGGWISDNCNFHCVSTSFGIQNFVSPLLGLRFWGQAGCRSRPLPDRTLTPTSRVMSPFFLHGMDSTACFISSPSSWTLARLQCRLRFLRFDFPGGEEDYGGALRGNEREPMPTAIGMCSPLHDHGLENSPKTPQKISASGAIAETVNHSTAVADGKSLTVTREQRCCCGIGTEIDGADTAVRYWSS